MEMGSGCSLAHSQSVGDPGLELNPVLYLEFPESSSIGKSLSVPGSPAVALLLAQAFGRLLPFICPQNSIFLCHFTLTLLPS